MSGNPERFELLDDDCTFAQRLPDGNLVEVDWQMDSDVVVVSHSQVIQDMASKIESHEKVRASLIQRIANLEGRDPLLSLQASRNPREPTSALTHEIAANDSSVIKLMKCKLSGMEKARIALTRRVNELERGNNDLTVRCEALQNDLDRALTHGARTQDVQSLIDNLAETLECKLCYFVTKDLYTLGCGHSFCGQCLTGWFGALRNKFIDEYPEWDGYLRPYYEVEEVKGPTYTCPGCRSVHLIANDLQPSYKLTDLIAIIAGSIELVDRSVAADAWVDFCQYDFSNVEVRALM